MLEMFYSQATPNDLFIGGLSGPGYMYSKAIPTEALPAQSRHSKPIRVRKRSSWRFRRKRFDKNGLVGRISDYEG